MRTSRLLPKRLCLLLILLFGATFTSMAAYDFEMEGIYYTIILNPNNKPTDKVKVVSGDDPYKGDVAIPPIITYSDKDYYVTKIDREAFSGCTELTSVYIPESVTSIGLSAFCGCTCLTSLTVDSNNTVYDSRDNCNAIIETASNILVYGCKNTSIPNSVTAIGNRAFDNCTGLTSINIPNTVTTIGISAFRDCTRLTSVNIPNSVTSINHGAFRGCTSLCKVNISSIESWCRIWTAYYSQSDVTDYATDRATANPLYYAGQLYLNGQEVTDLIIPETITTIGTCSFIGCSGLKSVTIPNSVTHICEQAFYGCKSLEKVHISDIKSWCNITFDFTNNTYGNNYDKEGTSNPLYYGGDIYLNGQQVSELVIPETITTIPKYAFIGCTGLKSVTIPNSITEIGYRAFDLCKGLTKVNISSLEAWCGIDFQYVSSNPLYYAHHLYLDGKEVKVLVIPSSVQEVKKYVFVNCIELERLLIAKSVTEIDSYAFYGCIGLTNIAIDFNNTVYDSRDNCNAIIETSSNTLVQGCMNTTIPNSVTSIGNYAFYGCTGLTSVTIPNSVTTIGYAAFFNCTGLNNITIPKSVTNIGEEAFSYSNLSSIVVESGNTVYDSRNNCNAIIETSSNTLVQGCMNTTIPNSVTSIGNYAFYGCIGLTSVTIPNSATTIGIAAFYACTGLKSITIPNSVTNIEATAFAACPEVNNIAVENGNTIYDSRDNCNAIIQTSSNTLIAGCMNTTIPNSITSISDHAFVGCSGLTKINIPSSITHIGRQAFYYCTELSEIHSYIKDPNAVNTYSTAFDGVPVSTCVLYVPWGRKAAYQGLTPWNQFTNIKVMNGGDVDGDGETTISDVNAIIDIILSDIYFPYADVNEDGEITIADVNTVISLILNGH